MAGGHRFSKPTRVRWRPLRRIAQITVGGAGSLVLVAAAVVVFGNIGHGGGGGTPSAQATVAASPTPKAVVNATAGNITITDAVIMTTGNDVAALYFNVKNSGPADTLTDQATNATNDTSLFNTVNNNGAASMPLMKSLAIPAHGEVQVKAGGYHIMLAQLSPPLAVGAKVHVTLTFQHAGKVQFDAPVKGY